MSEERMTPWLLACGIAGPALFVVAFLVEGATRPGYDPSRSFVSLLSLGPDGWQQVAAFIATGALVGGFGVGVRRVITSGPGSRWGPVSVALVAVALVGAGVFSTDPGFGYPPGAPIGLGADVSWHGAVHGVFAQLIAVGMTAAPAIFARRFVAAGEQGRARAARAVAIAVAVFWIGAAATGFPGGSSAAVAGLLQRIALVLGLGWLAAFAISLRRSAS